MTMQTILSRQKTAATRDGMPDAAKRIERLDRSIELLCTHSDALCDAIRADFGHRSTDESKFADVSGSIGALKFAKKHLGA